MKKIVNHIKNGTFVKVIRKKIYIKRNIHKAKNNPNKYLIGLGKIILNYKMNLENPKTFNEKLNWYKIHYSSKLMNYVVDKEKAKEYVKTKGLTDIIIPSFGVYNSIEDVDLANLPSKFVIKNTQDSGGVFVCKDKSNVKIDDIKNNLKLLNKEIIDGVHWALENVYVDDDNKIIVEDLLETKDGHSPYDYKIFCFNGEPKFFYVVSERDIDAKFDFYDLDFNWLDVRQGHDNNPHRPTRPENFERMLEIARILSKDFPHVRVDLYNIDGKIYFGELTFYHYAGLTPFSDIKWDLKFGEFFDITSINKNE